MTTLKRVTNLRNLLLLLIFFCFVSCSDEPTGSLGDPSTPTQSVTLLESFGSQMSSDFMGRIVDTQNNPVS
jgi:hypothetical protein